jgi:Family of unknown function (DUF6307)
MATEIIVSLSQYERRLKTVTDIVKEHSKLGGKAAGEIAVHVLHALDTIPEVVR